MPTVTPISSANQAGQRPDVLNNILGRAGQGLNSILAQTIQSGRQIVNNQVSQERDFLTEQRREINLKQRRAENTRQNFEDDREFERKVLEFDLEQDQEDDQFRQLQEGKGADRQIRRDQLSLSKLLGVGRLGVAEKTASASILNAKARTTESKSRDALNRENLKGLIDSNKEKSLSRKEARQSKQDLEDDTAAFNDAVQNGDNETAQRIFNKIATSKVVSPTALASLREQVPALKTPAKSGRGGSGSPTSKDKAFRANLDPDTLSALDDLDAEIKTLKTRRANNSNGQSGRRAGEFTQDDADHLRELERRRQGIFDGTFKAKRRILSGTNTSPVDRPFGNQ